MQNHVNSLAPERCDCNFELVIFKLISKIDILGISCEIALRWMLEDLTDDWSTLVQVIATWTSVDRDQWCHMVLLGLNELSHR